MSGVNNNLNIGFWQFNVVANGNGKDDDQFQIWNGDGLGDTLVKANKGLFGRRFFPYSVEMKYSDRQLREAFARAIRNELSFKCGKIDNDLEKDLCKLLQIENFSFSADKPLTRREIQQVVKNVNDYVANNSKPEPKREEKSVVEPKVEPKSEEKSVAEQKVEPKSEENSGLNPETDEQYENIMESAKKMLKDKELDAWARGLGDELFEEIFKDHGQFNRDSVKDTLRPAFDDTLKNLTDVSKDSWRKLVKSAFDEAVYSETKDEDGNKLKSIKDFKSRLRGKLLDSLKGECRNGNLVYECQLKLGLQKLNEDYQKGDSFYNAYVENKSKELNKIKLFLGDEKFNEFETQLKSDIEGIFNGSNGERTRQIRLPMIDEMAESSRKRQSELDGKLSEKDANKNNLLEEAHAQDIEFFAGNAKKSLEKYLDKMLERYDFGNHGGNVKSKLTGIKKQIDGSAFEIINDAIKSKEVGLLQKGGHNCFIVSVVNGLLNTDKGRERLQFCLKEDGSCVFPALMSDDTIKKITVSKDQLDNPNFAAPFDKVEKKGMSKLEIAIWEGLIAMAKEQNIEIKGPGSMEDAILVAHLFGLSDYDDVYAQTNLDSWANTVKHAGDEVTLIHNGHKDNYSGGHYFTIVGTINGNVKAVDDFSLLPNTDYSQKYVATNSMNEKGTLSNFYATDITMQKDSLSANETVTTLRRFRFVEIPDEPAKI